MQRLLNLCIGDEFMSSVNVRISEESHLVLRELSEREGISMQSLLDEAVEQLRRLKFLAQANAAFAALKADPRAWKAELEERRLWQRTLSDGTENR
jgi:hypothetical protein